MNIRNHKKNILRQFHFKLNLLLGAFLLLCIPFSMHAATFTPPLQNNVNFQSILVNLINFMLGFAALLALFALVYGGIRLIFGGFNNEQEAVKAKKIILWAIIGLSVIGLSILIIQILAFSILKIS